MGFSGASEEPGGGVFSAGGGCNFQERGRGEPGVFEAVKETNEAAPTDKLRSTVWVFGSNSDQNGNNICGDYTLGSAVIRLDMAFGRVAKAVQEGTFVPGLVKENLANGVCVAVLNPKLIDKGVISKEVVAEVEAAGKKLAEK